MNTRNLLIASALLAGGTTLLAAPPFLGSRLEQQFRATIAAQTQQGPLHWQLLNYDRGLYTSAARSRLELVAPDGQTVAFELDHRIRHGFGLGGFNYGTVTTTLRLDGAAGAALRTLFGDAEPLTLITRFGLDGNIGGRLVSPPVEGTLPLQPHALVLSWQGLEGDYRVTPDRRARIDLSSPGLVGRGVHGSLTLDGLRFRGRAEKSAGSGLWLGDSRLQIGQARFEASKPAFTLADLSISTIASETGGLVQSSLSYDARELQLGDDHLQNLRFKLTASHLDAGALKAYQLTMSRLARPPAAPRAALAEALRDQLPALLAGRPQLSLDEAQLTYQGTVLRLTGALRYVGINPHDAFSPLTDLAGEARLQLPRALLVKALQRRLQPKGVARGATAPAADVELAEQEADQFLARLNASGVLLAADHEVYTAVLRLQDGAVSLNGRPLAGLPVALPQGPPGSGI